MSSISQIRAFKNEFFINFMIFNERKFPTSIIEERQYFPSQNWRDQVIESLDGKTLLSNLKMSDITRSILDEAAISVVVENGKIHAFKVSTVRLFEKKSSEPISIPLPKCAKHEAPTPFCSPEDGLPKEFKLAIAKALRDDFNLPNMYI